MEHKINKSEYQILKNILEKRVLSKDEKRVLGKIIEIYNIWDNPMTLEELAIQVSRITQIPLDLMKAKTRKREIVVGRQLFYYISRKMIAIKPNWTLKKIGQTMGGRDHSTVISGCDTIQDLIETKDKNNYHTIKYVLSNFNIDS
jgi:chromosomal replication initiation ATPase DnaA